MAEQPTELRRINWSDCFPFTQVFRTFRMAIHPGKLGLALAGLILMGLWGVILDGIWRTTKCRPLDGEVNAFWQVPDIDTWRESVKKSQAERLRQAYLQMGQTPPEDLARDFAENPTEVVGDALDELQDNYEEMIEGIGKGQEKKINKESRRSRIAEIAREKNAIHAEIESLGPKGVFDSFRSFEMAVVRQLIDSARGLNFTGRLGEVISARSLAETSVSVVHTGPAGIGALSCVVLMLRGIQWLIVEHWLFAILFLLVSLAIWSWLGGAICRIAALNVARDERISPKDALSFARRKFLGFLTAPLLPIGLVAVIGVCLFIGGLLMAIPYAGDIIGGIGMGLALLGGFVIALVAVGAIGGGALMWPTIAVEGSDSFDAMSRSYSYVYSRPWRAGFYAAVATVYGALCYLFARFFVLVLLKATRLFVGWGIRVFPTYRPGTGLAGGKKIDALWPHPTFENLRLAVPPLGLETWGDTLAAFLIGVWVLLIVGLLCAFLVSFFFSGSTIIYYLLRQKVDDTDMEEVYVEQEEEESPPPAPAPESPSATSEPGVSGPPSASPPPRPEPPEATEESTDAGGADAPDDTPEGNEP